MQDVQFDPSASLLQLFCLIPSNIQQSDKNQQCRYDFTQSCKTEICLEAAVQCCNKQDDQIEKLKHIERLTQLLTLREQQGVGLHLAVQNKEGELFELHRNLQSKDEEIGRLNSKLNKIETEAALRQIMMSQMQSQLNCVWNVQFQKGRKFADKQRDENTMTVNNNEQIVILPERQTVIQQNYYQSFLDDVPLLTSVTQNSGNSDRRYRSQEIDNLNSQKQKFKAQNQELKRMLNDLEWRHFCLESELEMAHKEKQELKISCDKLDNRLIEYEGMIHDQMVSIYSLKEKNQWLSQDNIDMIEQMREKQKAISRLMDEQNNIKYYSKQESKELRYQIKEIQEEFREVTECLKMKIKEVDQCKRKLQFLEKEKIEMLYKCEKVQLQNYELEQSVEQHQQIMEKQSQKIEEFTRNTDFLNKKLQEECMFKIIRTREWEEKYRALEHIIRQKNQQLQQISSNHLESQIQTDRTIEDLQKVIFEIGESLKQSNAIKDRMQAEINQWELTSSIKDRTIEQYQRQSSRINLQSANIQSQISTLQIKLKQQLQEQRILENEKASFQNTVKSMKDIIQQMTIKLNILQDQLKNSIRNGAELQYQCDKNKKVIQRIIYENQQLCEKENQLSRDIERIRSQIKQIHSFVNCQIQSIVDHLEQPEHRDETVQFQVLQDNEHYQIIGNEDNQLKVIKHKIQQLLSSLNIATAKYI